MSENQVTVRRAEDGGLLVYVPMSFRKRYGRKVIIAPDGLDGENPEAHQPEQERLVVALARAHAWTQALDEGRYPSMKALAAALGKDPSYAARILRLTTLAPDIAAAIVQGREPDGLSLTRLLQLFPMEWDEQHEALGFNGHNHQNVRTCG